MVFFFVSYELVALLGLVLMFRLFAAQYDKWENWFLGKRGELAVRRALEALPDDYVLLNDLFLPNGRGKSLRSMFSRVVYEEGRTEFEW